MREVVRVLIYSEAYPQYNGEMGEIRFIGRMIVDGVEVDAARVRMIGLVGVYMDFPLTDMRKLQA